MPDTFSDFWRMVWEQHTANIIMITKLEEKSRVRALNYTYTNSVPKPSINPCCPYYPYIGILLTKKRKSTLTL